MQPVEVIGELRTAGLVLRAIAADDVDLLLRLDADAEVMRYINGGRASTRDEVEEAICSSVGHRWVAFEAVSGDFVGWFALRPTGEAEFELGYRLRRRWWGKGLASQGSRALVDAAFRRIGAERLWAETMTVNHRSRAVMEKCGLRYHRTFHLEWDEPIDGTELGEVEYELRRADWLASQLPSSSS